MDLALRNKTAFISGSSSGIGYAVAKKLAEEGSSVIINGRSEESVAKAKEKLLTEVPGASISGIAANFLDKRSVEALIDQLMDIDILVNNVGIYTSQAFQDTTDEDWFNMMEVNLMSGVRLSRALLPAMLDKNEGRIIFISSECAHLVPEDLIGYSTTKGAILSLSRGLAQLTKGSNVTVNTVLPGSTLSEGAERFLAEEAAKTSREAKEVEEAFFKEVRTTSLIQRFASMEEVANMIVYLSSPVSSATNGAAIKVDGGSIPGLT